MDTLNNIFWFGKKELTQDAVLLWIIKNYQDETLKGIARDIIGHFALGRKLNDDEKISNLRGTQQYKDIDVAVEFYLESNTNAGWYYLIVEDKTYSNLHNNQITKYLVSAFNEYEGKWYKENKKNTHIRMVYFKSMVLTLRDETEPKREAKIALSTPHSNTIFELDKDLSVFDLRKFYELVLREYTDSNNPILKNYCLYMKNRYDALAIFHKRSKNLSEFLIGYSDGWKEGQDERTIERSNIFLGSLFKYYGDSIGHYEFGWSQYGYYHLKRYNDESDNQKRPVIEVRSRDLVYKDGQTTIEAHLANYSKWFSKIDKESYRKMTRCWADYLRDKYNKKPISDGFTYIASRRTKNQQQLGIIRHVRRGTTSFADLLEIFNRLMALQDRIADELKEPTN